MPIALPPIPDPFPLDHGRYEVQAGQRTLGSGRHFRLDDRYHEYLVQKSAFRQGWSPSASRCSPT